jgi:hypothetical protein
METIELNGLTFQVEHVPDDTHGAPWEECDGHGIVSEWTTRDKKPGERVLCSDRGSKRYYDFEETVKLALKDAWGVKDAQGKTKRQIAAEAVERDFEFLRGWCNDEWYYVGVIVTLLDIEGEATRERESLWGVESCSTDYLDEVAKELAEEISGRIGDATKLVKETIIRA